MMAMMTRKLGMMSLVNDQGAFSALTLLQASPNTVTQIKTPKTDGYSALQLGFGTKKKLPKPQSGHFSRAKVSPQVCREFRCQEIPTDLTVGDQITTNNFAVGDTIKVTATSKGKGFAGTIKRHNFHRQSKTHGGKGNIRKLGSIGSMYPQKSLQGSQDARPSGWPAGDYP